MVSGRALQTGGYDGQNGCGSAEQPCRVGARGWQGNLGGVGCRAMGAAVV